MHAVLAIQRVALSCPKSADIIQAGNFGPIRTFVEYASAGQKKRFLSDLLEGRKLIALGMTEPQAGSDVTQIATRATPADEIGRAHVELQSLMRISYAVFRFQKQNAPPHQH